MPNVPASPRAIFRLAGEIDALHSPTERWMQYINLRIGTAHDYNREKAAAALAHVDQFITDAIALYQTLTGAEWPGAEQQ